MKNSKSAIINSQFVIYISFFARQTTRVHFLALLLFLGMSQNLYATDTVQIKIDGVEGELLKNVQAYLSIEKQKNHPRLSARRIRRLHQQAPDEIKQALQPYGYYRVKVTQKLEQEPTGWLAQYDIDLGEPIKLQAVYTRIIGDGEHDSVFQKQMANLPLQAGDILNHPKYEQGKRILRNLAEERGYFDAQFAKHEIRIDEQAYTTDVLLYLDTKQRYRFGEVTFQQVSQPDFFEKSLLRRFLTFENGDYYTGNALLDFKNSLTNSNYFAKVAVEMDRSSPTDDLRLPVKVTLEKNKPNKYSAGIGYGTDTGMRGSLEWKRRYVNRYGHRFSARAELSEIRQSATASYHIYTGKGIDDFVTIKTGYKNESTDTSDSEVLLLGISKHQPRILPWFNRRLGEVYGLEYRDEKYTVGSDSGHAKLLMPHISWTYIKADNRIYTRRGHKIQLELRGALNDIGSNTSFLQTRLNAIFIRQLFDSGRIIARGEIGYSSISLLDGDFHDLPPSIRFFAGGDRSVRGYDYQALGPKNLEGQVIGGKNLLVSSIEYEHKILDKWSLAVFYDVGNAFNDFSDPIKHGAGVGVRWQSPVGLIRIDVAAALSEEKYPLRLHITIGPDL